MTGNRKIIQLGQANWLVDWVVVAQLAEDIAHSPDAEVEAQIRYEIKEALKEARRDDLPITLADAIGIKNSVRARVWAEVHRLRKEREASRYIV